MLEMLDFLRDVFAEIVAGFILVILSWLLIRSRPRRVYIGMRRTKIRVKILKSGILSWRGFYRGVDRLRLQLRHAQPTFRPRLFVGINTGGILAAALLNIGDKPMAIVRTEMRGNSRKISQFAFPCLLDPNDRDKTIVTLLGGAPQKVDVLLVDEEFKSGETTKMVIDYLEKQWNLSGSNCRVAVLSVSEVDPPKGLKLVNLNQIMSSASPRPDFSKWQDKLLFISYLSSKPVDFPWE